MGFRPILPEELETSPSNVPIAPLKFRPISQDELQPDPTGIFSWDTIKNAGQSLAKGASDTIGFLGDYLNPFDSNAIQRTGNALATQGRNLLGLEQPKPTANDLFLELTKPSLSINQARENYIGNATPRNDLERYVDRAVEFIPGGLSLKPAQVGLAALSGIGAETAKDIGAPEWTGALLAPLAGQLGLNLAGDAISSLKSLGPEARAANILKATAGDEIANLESGTITKQSRLPGISEDVIDPFYKTRTLAEELQSPKLAQLQDQLTKRSAAANEALVANQIDRRALQQSLLGELSPTPQVSPESAGTKLREYLEKASKGAFGDATEQFQKVNREGMVPFAGVRDTFDDLLKKEYSAGGAPADLVSIAKEANKIVDINGVKTKLDAQPFGYVEDLRERAQQAWLGAKEAGNLKDARIANAMVKTIDEAIGQAPYSNLDNALTSADVGAYKAGNKLYSEASDTYRSGKLGGALGKIRDNQYFVKGSDAIEKFFDGTPEGTRQFLKALPDNPKALEDARGAIRDLITRETVTNDGVLAPERFRTFIRNNKDALSAEFDGKRLFDKQHIDTLEQIANDLGFLSGQSQQSVKGMALRASSGQPTTAQALMMWAQDSIPGRWARNFPGAKQLFDAYNLKVDEKLTQAMIANKSFASELIKKATPERVSAIVKTLTNQPLLSVAAGVGDESQQMAPLSGLQGTTEQQQQEINKAKLKKEMQSDPIKSEFLPDQKPNQLKQLKESPSSNSPQFGNRNLSFASAKYNTDFISKAMNRAERRIAMDNGEIPKAERLVMEDQDITPLVKAVTWQESRGNPNAVSPKGATGLMQIMPETAKEIAAELGIKKYDLKDPETNKKFGTYYLRKMLDSFDGDPELALAAYNAGAGRVKEWQKRYGDTWGDIIDGINRDISKGRISKQYFMETRKYVPSIIKKMDRIEV